MQDIFRGYASDESSGVADFQLMGVLLDKNRAAHAKVRMAEGIHYRLAKSYLGVSAV